MVGFACFAVIYPAVLKGTDIPDASHYLSMALWVFGVIGVFIFWVWGVMPHAFSVIMGPIEKDAKKGRLKPHGYGERILKSGSIFKFLNIHIDTD